MSAEQLENLEQLARRAVASPHWRFVPGMLTANGFRVVRRDDDGYTTGYGHGYHAYLTVISDAFRPDLRDPATLGCLLALVREAWGDHRIHMVWLVGGFDGWQPWNIERPILSVGLKFHTEAEALVAALEAAP